MLAPVSTMATTTTKNSSNLTFDVSKKIDVKKAKLLTETYHTTSLQYALIDDGEIVISGYASKNNKTDTILLTSKTMYGIGSTSKVVLTAARRGKSRFRFADCEIYT